MASTLSSRELMKPGREWRLQKFIDMYEKGEEFTLVQGLKKVKLIKDASIVKKLKAKTGLDQIIFTTNDSKKIKLVNLAKTSDFGGLADKKQSTTHIEEKEIKSIRSQLDEIRKKTKKTTVPIKIKNKIYDVFGIAKTPGTPKSDFHFLDEKGNEIVWMSHKDGGSAKDFQQWGGISKTVPNVHNHKETKTFVNQLEENFPDGLTRGSNIVKDIKDPILKAKSVYGDDYKRGSRAYGRNNVTLLLQGPVKIVQRGSYYVIVSNHTHENGKTLTGDYEPTFAAQYRSDRGAPIKNARASVWPKYVEKRAKTIKLPTK
jgi:hypothetical protein